MGKMPKKRVKLALKDSKELAESAIKSRLLEAGAKTKAEIDVEADRERKTVGRNRYVPTFLRHPKKRYLPAFIRRGRRRTASGRSSR